MNEQLKRVGLITIGALLFAFLTGFLGYEYGRYKTPAKIQTITKTVTVDHDVVHTVTQVQKQIVYVTKEDKDVHKVVVVDKKPTGEVVTTTTIEDKSKIATSNTTEKEIQKNKVEDHVVYQDREVTKTLINAVRPDWGIYLQGGYNFGDGSSLIPGAILPNKAVVGVQINRRLLGPIYGQIWGHSTKEAGIGIGLEF